jgi:hypothetical protein
MSKPTLFAGDINLILVSSDLIQLKSNLVAVFGKILEWFQANSLTLNLNKTHFMYFKAKISQTDQSTLKFMEKQINSTHCTDFLGVTLNSTLSSPSRDSSVGIAIGYGLDDQAGAGVRVLVRSKIVTSFIQTGSGVHTTS